MSAGEFLQALAEEPAEEVPDFDGTPPETPSTANRMICRMNDAHEAG